MQDLLLRCKRALGARLEMPAGAAVDRRVSAALFLTLLGTYGYFFQGGGWNQNSRIAQVRSLVEEHDLAINDYLIYRHRGRQHRLVRERILPGTPWAKVAASASSGDVLVDPDSGLVFPNKPPGATLVAAPPYLVLLAVGRLLGVNPDQWSVLTVNTHLLTLLSVGVAGALTSLLLLRLSSWLFPETPPVARVAAAFTCGLGTLMLPFSTIFFDHVLAAFWLLAAFAGLVAPGRRPWPAIGAGLAAGMAMLTNYTTATIAAWLLLYLLLRRRGRDAARYVAGAVPPLLLLAAYQMACFGSPFGLAKPLAVDLVAERGTGLFALPDPAIVQRLLFGGQRGLLVTSPVLALAPVGLVWAWRAGRRAEAAVAFGSFASVLLINGALANQWSQSGWSIGPRYLIPAIPFLCLGLTPAFARLPRITTVLAVVSAGLLLLATAVDVQPPRRVRHPLRDYVWPLWQAKTIWVYEDAPVRGPVSANMVGVYEGGYFKVFPLSSGVVAWNSYNLGELVWPRERISLLPLGLWLSAGITLTLAWSRRSSARSRPEAAAA